MTKRRGRPHSNQADETLKQYHSRLGHDAHDVLHLLFDWANERGPTPGYALQVANHALALFAIAAVRQFEGHEVTDAIEQIAAEHVLTLRRNVCIEFPNRVSERFRAETERMTREAKGELNQ